MIRLFSLFLLCAVALAAADGNRIILRVNDRIGTLFDYETRRDDRLRAIQNADIDPSERAELIENAGAEVLTDMLEELLVLSKADQIDYQPSTAEINEALVRARDNFGIETQEQFEQALAQSGMTIESFRRQLTVNMRVSGVLGREVQRRVTLTEEDLRRYYYENEAEFTIPENIRLRDIVVLDSSSLSADERRSLAEDVRDALVSGTSAEDVAARYEGDDSTSGVVDIGWVERGDLDPAIESAVWDLEVGDVSAPVEGRGGLHVVVVEDRQPAGLVPFDQEVAARIEQIERQRLFSQEYGDFMQELRDASYIRIGELPEDAQGFNLEGSASRLVFEGSQADFESPMEGPTESPESSSDEDENGESDSESR